MKYRVKILFKILLILSLSILVVCIIFFMKNQSNTIKNDAVVSSKQSKIKRSQKRIILQKVIGVIYQKKTVIRKKVNRMKEKHYTLILLMKPKIQ